MTRPDSITVTLWSFALLLLTLTPWISIPLGVFYNFGNGFGWTANLAMIPAFILTVTILGFSKTHVSKEYDLFLIPFFAFIIYAMSSLIWGTANALLSGALIFAIMAGYAAYIGSLTSTLSGHDPLPALFNWTLVAAILFIAPPLVVWLDPDAYPKSQWVHKLYGFGNPRSFGQYIAVAIIMMIGLSPIHHSPVTKTHRKIVLFGFLVVLWSLLMWTGSRGGFVSIIAACLVTFFLVKRLNIKLLALNIFAFISGALLSLLYHIPNHSYGILSRSADAAVSFSDTGISADSVNSVSSGRLDVWAWSIEAILSKPITGWGFLPLYEMRSIRKTITSNFPNHDLVSGIPNVAHAHNIILDYATSFGIPITIAVMSLMIWSWLRALKVVKKNPDPISVTAFMLITLLPIYSMFSIVLLLPYHIIVFATCLGVLHARSFKNITIRDDESVQKHHTIPTHI